MVLPVRIELTTSPLPRGCSTTELRQRPPEMSTLKNRGDLCHMGGIRASAPSVKAVQTLLRITFTVILRRPLRSHLGVTENWP
jgi:hypothetical protein